MSTFRADNPFERIELTLADLACISRVKGSPEIKPEHAPLLIGVENGTESNDKTGVSKSISRYFLVFPGSSFMKVVIKVEESAPSVTQEVIDQYGGAIRVNIQGFTAGSFETTGGGRRPYFRAARITPVQTNK